MNTKHQTRLQKNYIPELCFYINSFNTILFYSLFQYFIIFYFYRNVCPDKKKYTFIGILAQIKNFYFYRNVGPDFKKNRVFRYEFPSVTADLSELLFIKSGFCENMFAPWTFCRKFPFIAISGGGGGNKRLH